MLWSLTKYGPFSPRTPYQNLVNLLPDPPTTHPLNLTLLEFSLSTPPSPTFIDHLIPPPTFFDKKISPLRTFL